MEVLTARDVSHSFGETVALTAVSATVSAGEAIALVGSSGSGKSTLLYCLAGLIRPDSGEVFFQNESLARMSAAELTARRLRSFGFVFQFAELVPELTLRENISLPLELLGTPRRDVGRRVDSLLERLGLAEHAARRPAQVSGGQAQRAAVARAVVHKPDVVFADEPTGALDSANGAVVIDLLLELAREESAAVVLVTHDENLATRADRTVTMHDGELAGVQL